MTHSPLMWQESSGSSGVWGAQALLNCLMYKLSYYRFGEGALMATGRLGYDRVRQVRPRAALQLELTSLSVLVGHADLGCAPA